MVVYTPLPLSPSNRKTLISSALSGASLLLSHPIHWLTIDVNSTRRLVLALLEL